MSQDPLVTLGLPVRNGERYLPRALESILAQSFRDFELVISDNASTDATPQICRDFVDRDRRVVYRRNETNIGLAANHNLLVSAARGRYFKWVAHDDEYQPSMLQSCVAALEASPPAVGMVYTMYELIDESGTSLGTTSDPVSSESGHSWVRLAHFIMNVCIYNFTYGLIRTDVLRRTPLYGLYPTSDRVLFAELAMLGKLREIHEPLVRYRIHSGSSFRAQVTHQARREIFDPAVVGKRALLTHEGRLHVELVRRALLADQRLVDRVLCLVVALVIPPWQRLRNVGGRWKRRVFTALESQRA